MPQKKQGFPEDNEIVICTVKKILPHGVFVILDEYLNKEGLIHISEISPGRVRNIRDFVKDGKKIVCKILKINQERNQIDLSLRRVNQSQRINKNKEYKQEQKAEKILEIVGKELKISLDDIYKNIGRKLIDLYGSLHFGFEYLNEHPEELPSLTSDKKLQESLLRFIKERIKKKEIRLNSTLNLSSTASNGINIIKETLKALQEKYPQTKIIYLGAPRYHLTLTAMDYKTAENELKNLEALGKELIKHKGTFKMSKNDKRNT